METLDKIGRWLNSFFGALCMGVVSFYSLIMNINEGATAWAWIMGGLTLYWLWVARRALKTKAKASAETSQPLTDDQKQRLTEATDALHVVMKEVELEITQAERDAKEKARVQSNQRKDQEAGVEGTDGRTDSKEDRTP